MSIVIHVRGSRPRRLEGLSLNLSEREVEAAINEGIVQGPPAPATATDRTVIHLTPFGALLHRLRGMKRAERAMAAEGQGMAGNFALASREVRQVRLAKCVPGECPKAIAVPDCPRARCSAKGCGCDHLHAVRLSATCPVGRWPA